MQQMLNELNMQKQVAAAAQQRLHQIQAEQFKLQGFKENASSQSTQLAWGAITRENA